MKLFGSTKKLTDKTKNREKVQICVFLSGFSSMQFSK